MHAPSSLAFPSLMHGPSEPIRVLIIPGLHNSGPAHWQTWLQGQYRGASGAARVEQPHWDRPDLDTWAEQIARTIAQAGPGTQWVAVAHSFGCLALAHYLASTGQGERPPSHGIGAALLVAPADPVKFDVAHRLPQGGLGLPATLIGSENDPWMPLSRAKEWAHRWGTRFQNLGAAGHINTESGYGPWPLARFKVDNMVHHLQRQRRLERAHPMEFSFAL